ncbi:MAG: tetratricopeptide repeat protein [Treponema sp.]|jgi:tetratricopeptide (TPR) repeat protein|nr:tetratricopeptide repeat protein [Treponema sp.]
MAFFQEPGAENPQTPGSVVFIHLSGELLDRIRSRTHDHGLHDHHHEDDEYGHDSDEADGDEIHDDETHGDEPDSDEADGDETAPSRYVENEDPGTPAFVFDPAIPIPVELPPGENSFRPETLSPEMILSGMLRLLSASREESDGPVLGGSPRWRDYYRSLVLALRPGILPELTGVAILKARNGDFALALEILTALKGLCPGSPPVLLNRAMVLEERADALERAGQETAAEGEYLAAETAYGEALAENPMPDTLFSAGHFFLKRRDYSRALVCFRAYSSLEDREDGAGGYALDAEKRENALVLVREIEEGGLEDEDFRNAWEHVRGGREREGMESIRRFLERRPGVWNGWFLLGWALRRLERWADARSSLEKALELGGDNSDTRNELAICLMEMNDYPGARRHLETALRQDAENIKIISNLGVLAMRGGNKQEAAGFFRTVLELEPEDPLARRYFEGSGGTGC